MRVKLSIFIRYLYMRINAYKAYYTRDALYIYTLYTHLYACISIERINIERLPTYTCISIERINIESITRIHM